MANIPIPQLEAASTTLQFLGGAMNLFGGADLTQDEQAIVQRWEQLGQSIPDMDLTQLSPGELRVIGKLAAVDYEPAAQFVEMVKANYDPETARQVVEAVASLKEAASGAMPPEMRAAGEEAAFQALGAVAGGYKGIRQKQAETGLEFAAGGQEVQRMSGQVGEQAAHSIGVGVASANMQRTDQARRDYTAAITGLDAENARRAEHEQDYVTAFNQWQAGAADQSGQFLAGMQRDEDKTMMNINTQTQQAQVGLDLQAQQGNRAHRASEAARVTGAKTAATQGWSTAMNQLGTAQAAQQRSRETGTQNLLKGAPAAYDYLTHGVRNPPPQTFWMDGEEYEMDA